MVRTCVIMQPTYLPWIGYFKLIKSVEKFVFLDDVQINKRSWQQRNEILSCLEEPNIRVTGLMTVGPRTKNKKQIRKSFVELRNLRDSINKELGETALKDLSMGMSKDYEIAAEEGSTMIRIGTALFGKR